MAIATGPVDAKVKCRLRFFDLEAPATCTISGEGDASRVGFATGTAKFKLEQTLEGAAFSYFAIARIGGTLARLGERRMIDVFKALSLQFLGKLRKCVEDGAPADGSTREPV
ncbi:SRPBCC domain-containing protein [Bradyrhizobium sp. PRIMUS42]|uniref:CoxG family protein n=1 Tax=Bradyrhizobium sp. PRIMUS42 TaxID=2908926 RepID=UPI002867CC6B|nr:SRPBCC domain-containing protein [Bradyrhizobium sp. PRIMUS42]